METFEKKFWKFMKISQLITLLTTNVRAIAAAIPPFLTTSVSALSASADSLGRPSRLPLVRDGVADDTSSWLLFCTAGGAVSNNWVPVSDVADIADMPEYSEMLNNSSSSSLTTSMVIGGACGASAADNATDTIKLYTHEHNRQGRTIGQFLGQCPYVI